MDYIETMKEAIDAFCEAYKTRTGYNFFHKPDIEHALNAALPYLKTGKHVPDASVLRRCFWSGFLGVLAGSGRLDNINSTLNSFVRRR